MGKRKSRAKPPPKKMMDKLDSVFSCLFCNHETSTSIQILFSRMAEAIVSFLAGEISVFLKEEKKLLGAVRGDVEFIGHELEHMTAFLRAAELIEEPVDRQLSVWVKQVREIAFDIEDTLDEYKLQLRSDGRGAVSRFFKNLTYRHEIASQIQHLKSRIIDASQRPQRYQLSISQQVQRSAAASSIVSEQRGNALLLEEDEVVGIDGPKKELLGWLFKGDSTLKVISVVGMGGLGKTTLVKKVYDDFAVQKHFKIHAWITVSQSFKTEELLKNIIHQIFEESKQQTPEGMEGMESHDLKKVIKYFLQDSRYLLVLDDIWQVDAWDAIKLALPKSNHGSRLILTTRNENVAEASCSNFKGEVYRLEPLSSEVSWKLFCSKTFQEDQCPQHLSGIAQKIIEKCHGLPLAIVAVSGVLAAKRNGSADEWEMVSRNLSGEFQSDRIPSVKRILSLSYNDLPFNLKACMLHVSMFPEDFVMIRSDLVPLWIAEGFVEENEGKTLEEVADSYLNELLDRSLIIIDDPLKVGLRIHDLLREVILSKAKDQNFAAVVDEETTRWPESARRLCIHQTVGNIPDNRQRCVLRSLLVFGVNDFPLASLASDLRLLKVLDMGEANLEIFPKEITKLYHLRYLKLRGTNIRDIPSAIGRLQKLQYLYLYETSVTSLPRTILKLHQLRHLLVSSFVGFLRIGCLTCLQTLDSIEVNEKGGIDVIQELGKLTQLRTVGIKKLKKEHGPALCSSVEKLRSLEALFVESIDEEEIIDVQSISSHPKFLKFLILTGRMDKLPWWIQSLHCLTFLRLKGSQLCDNILEAIQDLPALVSLFLLNAFQGGVLCFKSEGFQKLKDLRLENLGALQRVEVQKGSMPGLAILHIKNCPSLKHVPFGVEHLSKLKTVEFGNLSDDLVTNNINGGGKDFRRLEHIPRVIFDP